MLGVDTCGAGLRDDTVSTADVAFAVDKDSEPEAATTTMVDTTIPSKPNRIAVVPVPEVPTPRKSKVASFAAMSRVSTASHRASLVVGKYILANQRVVKYGLSLPIIFAFSVAIGVSYALAYATGGGVEWTPKDLTGDAEWTSHTRTHLAQDPVVLLDSLLQPATIGVDTSVSVNFLTTYGVANELDSHSTAATFNPLWLDASYVKTHGFAIAGQMAGAFEAYGAWPCSIAVPSHPILSAVCPDPANDWFAIQIYNNLVATTSEKASTFLSLEYTPLALMTARVWPAMAPTTINGGIVVRGYKEGTSTERNHYVLKLEGGAVALAPVTACNRATQSNALECDRLEHEDIYVRNYATRDFAPLTKLRKLQVYGPALALGNYVAADKVFVQLPATAIVMTSTGYSATTRFSTTFPFRLTIVNSKLTTEYSIPQVASFTQALGSGFATATAQMVVVCLIVFNAIAHCHTSDDIVKTEGRIYGFSNYITMGIIARRLGTYKVVFVQLCVYHALNVGTYFSAVFNGTEKFTDTIAFGAEGLLLVVVASMLLDQLIFVEKYSSVREYMSVILSCGLYFVTIYVTSAFSLTSSQIQVTELAICARANQCTVLHGYRYYYAGLVATLVVPVLIINGPINRFVVATRCGDPKKPVDEDKLTTFEAFCIGHDARIEFGDFSRDGGATPISIVHAAGFTYMGPYLVRMKDFYMVVLARWMPRPILDTCGLTLTVFQLERGRVVSGRHMVLAVAHKHFKDAKHGSTYAPIP